VESSGETLRSFTTRSKTPRREKELLTSLVGNHLAAEYSVQYREKKELDTKDGGQNAAAIFPDKNVDSTARPAIVSAEDSHTLRSKTAGEPCSETFSKVKSSSSTEDKDSFPQVSRTLCSSSETEVKDSSSESSNDSGRDGIGATAGPQLEPVISSSEPLKDGSRTGKKSVNTESLKVDRSTGAHSANNTEQHPSLVSKFKNLVKRLF
jgi:hypothetical protein